MMRSYVWPGNATAAWSLSRKRSPRQRLNSLITLMLALPLAGCVLAWLACRTALRHACRLIGRMLFYSVLAALACTACLLLAAWSIAAFVSINPNLQ